MVSIVFYEKPGCINNTRQKKLLSNAGHDVECHNLLTTKWQARELRSYFGELPVAQWFNPSAPAIKNGHVVPTQVSENEALSLMLDDPLLIRRPLMRVGDRKQVGFDATSINDWIGLAADIDARIDVGEMEKCQRNDGHGCNTNSNGQV